MIGDAVLGIPHGVMALARRLLLDAGPADQLLDLLTAPRRLEPDWPNPTPPIEVGDGWVHAEIIDEDLDLFETLLCGHRRGGSPATAPERLAAAAQELRLPVSPYRFPPDAFIGSVPDALADDVFDEAPGAISQSPAGGATVIDLSTHWAGPLATKLLAEAGATVIKVDPDCRPDGFRARPRLYRHLNGAKELVNLDLRTSDDRRRFESTVSGADLVVESFSGRVMTNLGYSPEALRDLNPRLSTISIRAFPANTPEAGWLGYGPGVHAASGLGLVTGRPVPAALAYPDFLTGLAAHRRALSLLADDDAPARVGVSLLGTIGPIVRAAAATGDRPESPAHA